MPTTKIKSKCRRTVYRVMLIVMGFRDPSKFLYPRCNLAQLVAIYLKHLAWWLKGHNTWKYSWLMRHRVFVFEILHKLDSYPSKIVPDPHDLEFFLYIYFPLIRALTSVYFIKLTMHKNILQTILHCSRNSVAFLSSGIQDAEPITIFSNIQL